MTEKKTAGFLQALDQVSTKAMEAVGTAREEADGKVYHYCKNGAAALAAGKLVVAAGVAAAVQNKAMAAAAAIGDTLLTLTITSATYVVDYFKGGEFQINDGTGEGHSYPIIGSTAVSADTSINIILGSPIRVALIAADSEFTLVHNKYMAVVKSTGGTFTAVPAGIPHRAVPIDNYFWLKTKDPLALCLVEGMAAIGSPATIGASVDGAIDQLNTTNSTTVTQPIIGTMAGYATADTEYTTVDLNL